MLSFASATPLAYSGSAFAMPRVAPSMGLGFPSPKELAGDPKIEDVLRIAKTEQVARFARIAAQEALGGFQPGGAALMREMPGAGPFGYFDPWSLTPEDISEARRYREAELIHGRVSMMAALGFLVQENFHRAQLGALEPAGSSSDLGRRTASPHSASACLRDAMPAASPG